MCKGLLKTGQFYSKHDPAAYELRMNRNIQAVWGGLESLIFLDDSKRIERKQQFSFTNLGQARQSKARKRKKTRV